MATYAFNLPRKPIVVRFRNISTRLLLSVTLLWVVLYGWLGYRLWLNGVRSGFALNLWLVLATIVLGVTVILAWRRRGWRWLRSLKSGGKWKALSLAATYQLDPFDFEDYVAHRLFARQGYHIVNTPDVKDGGIDVLVTDDYGRQAIVQCKRYKGTVGSATVRELYGTMIHAGAARAYLVTTAEISADARRWAAGKPIELIDGTRLVQLARAIPNSQRL
ncbi:MAG: restriction endonuclease [Caldilineaceae bacterium]|nr:restriction endonuclease [Caldilineaceae bacterium]